MTYRASSTPSTTRSSTPTAAASLAAREHGQVRRRRRAVWENYPGAASGRHGAAPSTSSVGWLPAGARGCPGPNVHAFSDLDDDDASTRARRSRRGRVRRSRRRSRAAAARRRSRARGRARRRRTLAARTASRTRVQAFYLANRFHDHLARRADRLHRRRFEGADRLVLQTDDGAATGPNNDHINNANMCTPPDGSSPMMQMYLWRPAELPRRSTAATTPRSSTTSTRTGSRTGSSPTPPARGALNSPQAGAMGEGWSDWYAKDFLVAQFPALDTRRVGRGRHGRLHRRRRRTRSARRRSTARSARPRRVPGRGLAGAGGYTYGDFGKIDGGPEVHADGEIWAETLWDLRDARSARRTRERLITQGMRLSPPEPSFLDMRNAILHADQAAGGAYRDAIWTVFARRGMGFYASTDDARRHRAGRGLLAAAGAGDPRGRIAGRVTRRVDRGGRRGCDGRRRRARGRPGRARRDDRRRRRLRDRGVPARSVSRASCIAAPGYDRAVAPVTVPAGTTTPSTRRCGATGPRSGGGATVTPATAATIRRRRAAGPTPPSTSAQGTGWSTRRAPAGKSMVITLPRAGRRRPLRDRPGRGVRRRRQRRRPGAS